MGQQLQKLTFDAWVIHVFDHPVEPSLLEWYWDLDADRWDGSSAQTVEFLTHLFENAATVLEPYSDAQLNQGLWYIVSNGCSDYMFALMDERVPWLARRQCIRSVEQLFVQCFARRCTPHLSHLDQPGASPLNLVCYMWWDLMPISGSPLEPARQQMDDEILHVMESTLQLNSIACQESALHGLGHWHLQYPVRVQQIIDFFLKRHPELPDGLSSYAANAARGCIL